MGTSEFVKYILEVFLWSVMVLTTRLCMVEEEEGSSNIHAGIFLIKGVSAPTLPAWESFQRTSAWGSTTCVLLCPAVRKGRYSSIFKTPCSTCCPWSINFHYCSTFMAQAQRVIQLCHICYESRKKPIILLWGCYGWGISFKHTVGSVWMDSWHLHAVFYCWVQCLARKCPQCF